MVCPNFIDATSRSRSFQWSAISWVWMGWVSSGRVAEVAGVGQYGGVEVADQVGVARLSAAGMGECLAEVGVAVDLDEQRGEVDLRKPRGDRVGERRRFGGHLFGG